jgi:hypothetical protein
MSSPGSGSGSASPHFFTAVATADGFEVTDDVLPSRVYVVPVRGTPTLRGRTVTNPLTLARIGAAVEEWVERALLEEIEDQSAALKPAA